MECLGHQQVEAGQAFNMGALGALGGSGRKVGKINMPFRRKGAVTEAGGGWGRSASGRQLPQTAAARREEGKEGGGGGLAEE